MLIKTKIFTTIIYGFLIISSVSIYAETPAEVESIYPPYHIGAGDLLKISVWKEENMQLDVLVAPDGAITFPLAGEIRASGLTTSELTSALANKLKRYIPNPNITVTLQQSRSNKVYVIGKVNRPGEFVASGYMDVLQALTMAGGLTPFADSDEIKIIRRTKTGAKVRLFDYDEVVSGERLDMNIILKAGDTVVVP
ncbi:MAG: sugar transporter [Thiotrichaceae bacterium]|nr:MAG: sugar transporter [Thiotrichaceae bacterium]